MHQDDVGAEDLGCLKFPLGRSSLMPCVLWYSANSGRANRLSSVGLVSLVFLVCSSSATTVIRPHVRARTSYVHTAVANFTLSSFSYSRSTMAFAEKDATTAYSPLRDDQSSDSARESDELLHDGYPTARPSKSSRKKRALIAISSVALLLAYSFLLTTATSMYWKKQRVHGANVIDSKFAS